MSMETEPQKPPGTDRPDADALMERVRAGVAEKIARGVYTAEELERVRRMELSIKERKDFGPDVGEGIAFLHAHWDPLGPHPITSHRPGAAGRLIVGAKIAVRKVLKPFASLVLSRQSEYNGAVARLLTSALHGVQNLEMRFDELLLKHYDISRRHQKLYERYQALVLEARRYYTRVESMERASLPAEAVRIAEQYIPPLEPSPVSYLAFEEKHRGSSAALKEKQRGYLRHFRGATQPVLDAGCGRGEFLHLLREAGIQAYGVDFDAEMTARCREQGLAAVTGDILTHLAELADGSLGGIFAAQVVEHMTTPQLAAFARLAHDKIAAGGRFVAETINPACLGTFSGPVYLDLTHIKPVHPEALRFLLDGLGFRDVALEFSAPFPPEMKLQEIGRHYGLQQIEEEVVRVVNDNFGRLNALIYGFQDYAAVATK